ncbi:uncharacterized protein [Henckelia pumila]|uniref:uncharacterized protein n=1 Tax=Henckelia pumila TaxID=405737 RepID=UPI003C6DFD26
MARGGGSIAGNNNNQAPLNPIQMNHTYVEDSNSPFFLQSGDHPGLILVPHQLTGSNYTIWSRSMVMALTAKNKLCFVDNTIPRSLPDDLLYDAWIRCNSMVTSWILNFVKREIAASLMYMTTCREVWIDLHDRFHESNVPRIYQIKKMIYGY